MRLDLGVRGNNYKNNFLKEYDGNRIVVVVVVVVVLFF